MNLSGYIFDGFEYLIIFDGVIGKVLKIVNYILFCGKVFLWGDLYGNRVDRFLVGVVYFDGL